MQRQSLGSPSTKHFNEAHNQPNSSSSSSSTPNTNNINIMFNGEEDELKKLKLKPKTATTPESYIHLIPMLTLLCIFILFLSSHPPSHNDMAQFNAFNHFHNPAGLGERILELKGMVEIKKGGVLSAIRSLKIITRDELKYRRLHRKLGSNN